MVKANQDIRDYMDDHGVSQRKMAELLGVSAVTINKYLKTELSPKEINKIGTVSDIWHSLAKSSVMYAVEDENGHCGLYAEDQLEPAPLPIEYTFSVTVETNVAVVCMIAHQGEKSWVHARGHAHILHDGDVGEAQAVSYAARRMFESLDTKQENPIYFKDGGNK